MKSTTSILPRVVGVLVVFSVVGAGLVMWQFNRPPFDLIKLREFHGGTTPE